jgi:hypothetical protein
LEWGETESTWYVGHYWPIVPALDDTWWVWSSWWNKNWQRKPKYLEKTCHSATLSTTNPTWLDSGSNVGSRDQRPTTNRLSYRTVYRVLYLHTLVVQPVAYLLYRPSYRGMMSSN